MKVILKFRWLIAAIIIVSLVLLTLFAPNLTKLANEKGEIALPADQTSVKANNILRDVGKDENSLSIVITSKEKITSDQEEDLNKALTKIKKLDGVESIVNPFDQSKEVRSQLFNKSHDTLLIPVTTIKDDKQTIKIKEKIEDILPSSTEHYITGQQVINDDLNHKLEKGLQLTEIITVVLILSLLFIVFRSIVTPLIPLILVGIAYAMSQGVLALMVKHIDFPISSYIQSFMIAILFGVGTDYCILLLTRFKEELSKGRNNYDATLASFQTGGKTIMISAVSVLVGFASIYFAKFDLFRSAFGIAVGVLMLLIVIYTLLPLLFVTFGQKLFWPSKKAAEHKDNKLWGALGRQSINHPLMMIVLTGILMLVPIIFVKPHISYDTTSEISNEFGSIKGLEVIKDSFGKGDAFPVTMIIKDDDNLTTPKKLSQLEDLSQSIEKIDGVASVRTITRPAGETIEDLYAANQLKELSKQLNKANKGIGTVGNGLEDITRQIKPLTSPQAMQQITDPSMISGQAGTLSKGLNQSAGGLDQAHQGIRSISDYMSDIAEDPTVKQSGIYISEETRQNKDFKKAVDNFAYDNGRVVTLTLELKQDPYTHEAIDELNVIKRHIGEMVNQTSFKDSEIEYSGITSTNADMASVIDKDMTRSVILILTSLFIVLVLFMRSIVMPLYVLVSILLTYYASIGIANLIFTNILGYEGLGLAVPFFSFVILMALGVDYAIFLLDRFKEEAPGGIRSGLLNAMVKMGTVIMTAAIILIGTFAALLTSGSLTLTQIASVTIIGLVLYTLLMLPLFIPSVASMLNQYNWWPFSHKK